MVALLLSWKIPCPLTGEEYAVDEYVRIFSTRMCVALKWSPLSGQCWRNVCSVSSAELLVVGLLRSHFDFMF